MAHVNSITLHSKGGVGIVGVWGPAKPEAQQFELPVAPDGQLFIIPSNLYSCFRAGGYLVGFGRGGVDVGVGNIDDWKELCGKEGAVVSGPDGGDAGRVAADEVEVTRGLPFRSVGIGSNGCVESDIDPGAVFEQRWSDG